MCICSSLEHVLPDSLDEPANILPPNYAMVFNSLVRAFGDSLKEDAYIWVIHLVAASWVLRCGLFPHTQVGRIFRTVGSYNRVCSRRLRSRS